VASNAAGAGASRDAVPEQVEAESAEATATHGTAHPASAGQPESLRETVHLLRSPRNASRLRESVAEASRRDGAAGVVEAVGQRRDRP
jgi:antitoxin YefM